MSIEESVILLACLEEPQHGYEIYRQIIADTTGRIYIRPATTYRMLRKLAAEGMLDELESSEPKRRSYRITRTGRERLEYQASLYRSLERTITERLRG